MLETFIRCNERLPQKCNPEDSTYGEPISLNSKVLMQTKRIRSFQSTIGPFSSAGDGAAGEKSGYSVGEIALANQQGATSNSIQCLNRSIEQYDMRYVFLSNLTTQMQVIRRSLGFLILVSDIMEKLLQSIASFAQNRKATMSSLHYFISTYFFSKHRILALLQSRFTSSRSNLPNVCDVN